MRGWFRVWTMAAGLLFVAVSARAENPYQDEIAVMTRTVGAFDRSSELIENASTAEDMTAALSATAEELNAVFAEMSSVTKAHPDWGRQPPAEVKPTMELFDKATNRLFDQALPKALAFVNDHQDNEELQKAFGKVNSVLYHR